MLGWGKKADEALHRLVEFILIVEPGLPLPPDIQDTYDRVEGTRQDGSVSPSAASGWSICTHQVWLYDEEVCRIVQTAIGRCDFVPYRVLAVLIPSERHKLVIKGKENDAHQALRFACGLVGNDFTRVHGATEETQHALEALRRELGSVITSSGTSTSDLAEPSDNQQAVQNEGATTSPAYRPVTPVAQVAGTTANDHQEISGSTFSSPHTTPQKLPRSQHGFTQTQQQLHQRKDSAADRTSEKSPPRRSLDSAFYEEQFEAWRDAAASTASAEEQNHTDVVSVAQSGHNHRRTSQRN